MDKRRCSYNLEDIKKTFLAVSGLRMTRTAHISARALGLRDEDVISVIQNLKSGNFYKSMTTYADSRVWQDVYHARFGHLALYVKFMKDERGHLIVSFKEK